MSNENNATVITLAALIAAGNTAEASARLGSQANGERVASLAEARVAKAQAAIEADQKFIDGVRALLPQLPVGQPSGAKILLVKEGDTITFTRRTKEGAVSVVGKVVGIIEGGRYRTLVGEGVNSDFVNVFPGTVTAVAGAAAPVVGEAPETEAGLDLGGDEAQADGVYNGATDAAVDALLD